MSFYYEVLILVVYVKGFVMLCIDHPIVERETCKTPGCKNFRYKDSSGRTFDYCSKFCRDNQSEDGT